MTRLGAAATLALSGILLLAGCGSDAGPTTAEEPTPTPSSTPAPTTSAPATPTTTASAPADPAPAGQEEAEAFRAFARDGSDLPPLADQVDLYLGNALTGFVTRAQARRPQAWGTCTELGEYAGRACPLSPLDVLTDHRAVAYVAAPDGRCLKTYGPVPPDLRKLNHVAVVPAPGSVDSCVDDFAVQLFSNDAGELVAVSLLLGEP
ncbi:hypothetical protein [Nocardioides sp. T2.26MG-1]|uniref:hypothetical protein n=1 Tax=Nocardioides sp. T2.26MG-1 TaxID=3041166 RepID=UPI0024779418|nr:hypothetical protein [Nocardioides sp. T2.26MG-1]CAI9412031.1 hypothetical protein HIDPHFAB_01667 [Nocardioides sp. T2.26MG-1]